MLLFFSVIGEEKCEINFTGNRKTSRENVPCPTFSLAVFLFPVTKRAEKVCGFVFFRERRGKILNKL